ncbi:MAG: hypothetical protein J7513_06265 [Solirubrobacteraceae bacterium]|nr:hypothetical protein [Solirubrobacteraceae bacterium]
MTYRFTFEEDREGLDEPSLTTSGIDAVELVTTSGQGCVVTWGVDGPDAGMAIVERDAFVGEGPVVTATSASEWAGLTGATVRAVFPSWQRGRDSDTLWSLRLAFASGDLVIAIGGLHSARVMDEIVATRNDAVARSLHSPSAVTDAWGEPAALNLT